MKIYNISLNNLQRRKGKMFLIFIGLSIGIATVISVYAIIQSMKIEMTRQVSDFGVNVVITPDIGGLTFSYGGITLPEIMYDAQKLYMDDLDIIDSLPSRKMIRTIVPKIVGLGKLDSGNEVIVIGTNIKEEFKAKSWLRIYDEPIMIINSEENNEIEPDQDSKMMEVQLLDLERQNIDEINVLDNNVLVGYDLAKARNLRKGDSLRISDTQFEVYGIIAENGSVEDQQIFMNISSGQQILSRDNEITVIEMGVDYFQGSEEQLIEEIGKALPNVNIASLRQENFRRDEMLTRFVRFGMAISALVLLVGVLVVALTMMSSVRERTREIGVFRAIGFRKKDIFIMLMIECVIISIAGGLIGYALGTAIAKNIAPIISDMNIQIFWSLELLALALITALFSGLVASIYPAYKAANKDPVESLRFM